MPDMERQPDYPSFIDPPPATLGNQQVTIHVTHDSFGDYPPLEELS
jgi:hypothetical protein